MRKKVLSEICEILIGRTPSRSISDYWGKGHKWVSISDMKQEIIYETKEEITEKAIEAIRCRKIPKGTLLLSFKLSVGKLAFAGTELYTNEAIAALVIKDSSILNSKFLYYALKSIKFVGGNQAVMGITLNSKSLGKLKIPLPPLDDQIRIAAVLTRAEKLIAKRKESIKALDELLKSTFLEMFGDPVRNEKNWDKKRIDEIANTRLGKMRDKQFITGNHLKYYLGNSNVRWFFFDFDSLEQMDFDEKERSTFSLEHGDLLVCEGGEIGRCAIWKSEKKDIYFQKALHRVRVDITKVNQRFLAYVFFLYSLGNGFKNVGNKSTIAHLTGEKLKETPVPLPPLPLQNQFAAIVEKVESIRAKHTRSLAELEVLYGSLSQLAFKGELDLSRIPVENEATEEGSETNMTDTAAVESQETVNYATTELNNG